MGLSLFWEVPSDLANALTGGNLLESARVITDRFTGRSRGFGFVEMSSEEEAQTAIDTLNGSDLEGRSLTVNEARPQENRGGGGGGGGRDRW